jgi:hypothetical protein
MREQMSNDREKKESTDGDRWVVSTPNDPRTVEINGREWVPKSVCDRAHAEIASLTRSLAEIRKVVLYESYPKAHGRSK